MARRESNLMRGPQARAGAGNESLSGLVSARVRDRMVERVRELGVRDARVLEAIRQVPRHAFVDEALASRAYEDTALPIGHGQTISQPYIVARIAELALEDLADARTARVLEIGTGCGYAVAVLAQLFGEVVSVERLRALHERARENLRPLRLSNVRLVFGDGAHGVAAAAPYERIVAAAAGDDIPPSWVAQLNAGGRIVAPVGTWDQQLTIATKDASGRVQKIRKESVRFVPLRGGVA
ncbi:MAG: protein-L-isoaspartate(D-aspartate) O-methyltransferase [Burkholderiaceae bacterium]|nr:protein-L-isoaspartate(D-aspartate) O-methyltransferase [Burkholderiaceae bacterium]